MTLFQAFGQFAGAGAGAAPAGGAALTLMVPTSLAYRGTSATINANGSVSFEAIDFVSIRECFSADYEDYLVVWHCQGVGTASNIELRVLSGTTEINGTDYTRQYHYADNASYSSGRTGTLTKTTIGSSSVNNPSPGQMIIYGPYLAGPTMVKAQSMGGSPFWIAEAGSHSLSASYDGMHFQTDNVAKQVTGRICIYGIGA